jgi:hypothetical protein
VYVPSATLLHRGTSSSDESQPAFVSYRYLIGRNMILVARQHAGPGAWAKLLTLASVGVLVRLALQAGNYVVCAARDQLAYARGVLDALRDRPQPVPIPAPAAPVIDRSSLVGRLLAWIAG